MAEIAFLGGGNMAEALIKGILAANLYTPDNIHVSDVNHDRLNYLNSCYNINLEKDNTRLAASADTIILCVKPQSFPPILADIKNAVTPDKLIISIAAGITTSKIQSVLGLIPVIRVMPNTPALISQGAAAIYANQYAKSSIDKALQIFSSFGIAVTVESESLIDAVTAVSGSGPAYFFLLMEEMIKTAQSLGLSEDIAKKLVLQTAKGAALLAVKSADSPEQLREKVTSPHGITEAAIKVFTDKDFTELISSALSAARDRSIELSS